MSLFDKKIIALEFFIQCIMLIREFEISKSKSSFEEKKKKTFGNFYSIHNVDMWC